MIGGEWISRRSYGGQFKNLKKSSDLISRQAVINAIIRNTAPHDNGDGTTTISVLSPEYIWEILNDLPAVEPDAVPVVPVVRCGECVYYDEDSHLCDNGGSWSAEDYCSYGRRIADEN